MPSGPVAESESRVDRIFSTLSGGKDRVQEQLGTTGYGGYREGWVWDTRFRGKHRVEAFSFITC